MNLVINPERRETCVVCEEPNPPTRHSTCSRKCRQAHDAAVTRELWRRLVHLQIEALIRKHQPPDAQPRDGVKRGPIS